MRRETAALLEAVTPVLAEASSRGLSEPPEPLSGDDGDVFAGESDSPNDAASPRALVARFARQLREQARLTEDAAAARARGAAPRRRHGGGARAGARAGAPHGCAVGGAHPSQARA